jgi:predicted nucleotidyltransferase component of viral defense system
VCYALKHIFESSIGKQTVFKGGTALSKCYNLIERFSEDIDLVAIKSIEDSGNQLKEKLRKITKNVGKELTEIKLEGITNKMGMIRKVAYEYPKSFKGDFGQVRNTIIVECSWLGRPEPFSTKEIQSYIYDMMLAKEQHHFITEYNLEPFAVQVLDVKRTIGEKIMSLIRFSQSENPIEDLKKKIRHLYDLHQLLKQEEYGNFFESDEFEEIMLQVKADDIKSLKTNIEWIENHPSKALLFKNPKDTWNQLKVTYTNEFNAMVYGDLPVESDILITLVKISNRLKKLKWNSTKRC